MGGIKGLYKEGDITRKVNQRQFDEFERSMAGTIDPRVIQQMGGLQNIFKQLQQLQGGAPPGISGPRYTRNHPHDPGFRINFIFLNTNKL